MILNHSWNTSFKPVLWGYFLALFLTIIAFTLAKSQYLSGGTFFVVILGLALISGVTQLILFLHLGLEEKPRWNLMIFLFMILIMVVIILGSIWIMQNLNYNMMEHHSHG